MNGTSINDRADTLRQCLEECVEEFQVDAECDLSIAVWEQLFSSTACGFPGIGGAAMTRALVITVCPVAGNGYDGPTRVYMNGRFAYAIEVPNDTFEDHIMERKLMDARHYKGQYEQQ